MGVFLHLLLACLLFPAITGLQWVFNDRHTFACTGQTVTLPLDFSADAGEEITAVGWFFGGSTEQKMIATSSRGIFSTLLTFSHRVQQAGMGGLMIRHVTVEDAGSYTIEVNGTDDLSVLRNVTLHVADSFQTENGVLNVKLQPEAILDTKTHQWSVVLACGHFVFPQPPFAVEWITPSGTIVPSSTYTDGWFHLHLARSLQEGTYVCRVPPSSTCLPANQSTSGGQASIKVERGEMRMMLMEAELASLTQDKLQLQQQLDTVNRSLISAEEQLTQQAADINQTLTKQWSDLEAIQQRDKASLSHMIQDMITPRVAFNAKSPRRQSLSSPAHVRFPTVFYNQGGGFNTTTMDFTAPVSGIYVFYFHVMSDAYHFANSFLMVRFKEICTANCNPHYNHASCQAAVHMNAGDRAWVEPAGDHRFYWLHTTSFTGFLLSHDRN